ncbi:MAG: chemotaxis protein CheA, partial [Rubrobacteridae bacterium]|nr:chemotaxis protein CheA [Rubrobacteridae bacterium]
TLKGSSGMLGHERMAELNHAMETLFDKLRKNEIEVSTELIDLFLDCLDTLKILKEECITLTATDVDVKTLSKQILDFADASGGNSSSGAAKKQDKKASSSKTTKKQTGKKKSKKAKKKDEIVLAEMEIDAIRLAEIAESKTFDIKVIIDPESGMPSVRLYQVIEELQGIGTIVRSMPEADDIEEGKCGFEVRVIFITDEDQSHIESLIKSISELDKYAITLYEVEEDKQDSDEALEDSCDEESASEDKDNYRLGEISGTLNEVTAHIGQITNELQEEVMRARMLPIEQVFNKFPRLVRDLARNMNKQINFVVEGKETEIDRSVLEEIGDPLIHIIRNAIDHGIETPEDRKTAGKSPEGNVYLGARHEENHIVVEVSDDGKGMDAQKLKDKAIAKGFLSPEVAEKMSDREAFDLIFYSGFSTAEQLTEVSGRVAEKMSDRDAFDLIFYSGFSTAEQLTEVSGRGVGMDVVRNNIKKINGTVEIDSEPGKGSKFIIKLPLTLVIVDALVVVLNNNLYAIPLGMVKEVLQLNNSDIKKVAKMETLLLRGSVLPLLKLDELFGRGGGYDSEDRDGLHVVVVGYGENKVGIVVDRLVSKMEIMIKALGDYLGDVDGVSGATILGDGSVALVVDPISLIAKVDSQQAMTAQISSFGARTGGRMVA